MTTTRSLLTISTRYVQTWIPHATNWRVIKFQLPWVIEPHLFIAPKTDAGRRRVNRLHEPTIVGWTSKNQTSKSLGVIWVECSVVPVFIAHVERKLVCLWTILESIKIVSHGRFFWLHAQSLIGCGHCRKWRRLWIILWCGKYCCMHVFTASTRGVYIIHT